MTDYYINRRGHVDGSGFGPAFFIVKPIEGSPSYYVYWWPEPKFTRETAFDLHTAMDNWVEDENALAKYFGFIEEEGGKIRWFDEPG